MRHGLSRRPQSCKSKPEGLKQLCMQSGPSLQPPAATGLLGRRVWQGSAYYWAVDGLDCKRAQGASGTGATIVVSCCYLGLRMDICRDTFADAACGRASAEGPAQRASGTLVAIVVFCCLGTDS